MTPGERCFSLRLEDKLEGDCLCWYDVPVGPGYRHPDFIVLHPHRGILMPEVEDWKPGSLEPPTMARDRWWSRCVV